MESGAYVISDATTFSFPRPGIVGVNGTGASQVVRHGKAFRDLAALDKF